MACSERAAFVFVDSFSPIFEVHDGDTRTGAEQRLQCEGHLWSGAVNAWLAQEKEQILKRQQESDAQKAQEEGGGKANGRRRKKKRPDDPVLPDNIEDRLEMGYTILINLVHDIHLGVLNTSCLLTEYGCSGLSTVLDMENTSLLLSVPQKLEPYPGRTGVKNGWMGKNAVRFHAEQRGTVPAEGAAPAAEARATSAAIAASAASSAPGAGEAAEPPPPAAEPQAVAAAPANSYGEDGAVPGTPLSDGDGGSSRMPGKVRTWRNTFLLTSTPPPPHSPILLPPLPPSPPPFPSH